VTIAIDAPADPRLSIVLVGRDGMQTLGPILSCLSEQTIAAEIELIAVLPKRAFSDDALVDWQSSFHSVRTVCVPAIGNRGRAAAAGVRLARAPILAFTENHCFPDPAWADRLCASHSEAYVGVAPVVLNANPLSHLSWASYGGGYAEFADRGAPEEIAEMPLHNTSYLRAALAPLENELEELLEHEGKLQARLAQNGGRFLLEPAARTSHINEATWLLVLGLSYFNGRRYGGNRCARWGFGRRFLYAALFPLLSVNVTRRTFHRLKSCEDAPSLSPGLFAVVWLQSMAHVVGEAVGYLRGPRQTFAFVDLEEFMIVERLGGHAVPDLRLAEYIAEARPVDGHLLWGETT